MSAPEKRGLQFKWSLKESRKMCKIDQINPSGGCDTKPTRSLGWFGNAAGALGHDRTLDRR